MIDTCDAVSWNDFGPNKQNEISTMETIKHVFKYAFYVYQHIFRENKPFQIIWFLINNYICCQTLVTLERHTVKKRKLFKFWGKGVSDCCILVSRIMFIFLPHAFQLKVWPRIYILDMKQNCWTKIYSMFLLPWRCSFSKEKKT